MTAKKTAFKYSKDPLPDYEILTEEEIARTSSSDSCCNCANPNTSWCNPESPNGIGAATCDWWGSWAAYGGAK